MNTIKVKKSESFTKYRPSKFKSKPIIKWVGSKTQIVDKILDNFPSEIDNYYELFLGGGSVLLGLLKKIQENKIKINCSINAYDINETLIYMFKNIQSKHYRVLIETKKIVNIYKSLSGININRNPANVLESLTSKESYFYWIRWKFNKLTQEKKNTPLGTAYFIFLNKTGSCGEYRVAYNGYNVPYGKYTNPEIINDKHIKNVSKLIKNVNFYHLSFEKVFDKISRTDFMYLDPPCAPKDKKLIVNSTTNGFSYEQHKLLFSMCRKFKFLMTNSDVSIVNRKFKDKKFTIKTIFHTRKIKSKTNNSKRNELLIKSY